MSLSFRWLGVAGVELRYAGEVLAIDPFFTRPSLTGFVKGVTSDRALVAEKLPKCNAVLVTHSHWDHLMDVPEVIRCTGARAFGSANTCQLMEVLGAPSKLLSEIHVGDRLTIGGFHVEVIEGQHSSIPFENIFHGAISPGLQTPLRLQDYRMDVCLGYCIRAGKSRVLICAAQPQPVEILFAVAQETREYYLRLFEGTQPRVFVPIHWDNFLRPLSKPLRRFTRPGRLPMQKLVKLAGQVVPGIRVIVPDIFATYEI